MDNSNQQNDKRISSTFSHLTRLKGEAKKARFSISKFKTSKLSGRHGSKLRGRGVDFEEIKNYRKGDDVKSIDWKLTLRTGTPYIRSYTEEKDRNIYVCVDQSQSMFFSSVDTMKSVVAAEIAAIISWKMLSNNDRIGGLIATEEETKWFSPKRGEKNMLIFLQELALANQSLLNSKYIEKQFEIESKIDELLKKRVHSSVIWLISDFYNISDEIIKKIKKLQHTNDVVCIHVYDKLENEWDDGIDVVFSDGVMQFSSDGKNEKIKKYFNDYHTEKQENLKSLSKISSLPFFELNTNGDHIKQFFGQLSGVSNG